MERRSMNIDEIIEFGVATYGLMINIALAVGNYSGAQSYFADLKWLIEELDHSQMVALVNKVGVTHTTAGWLVKAWCENKGIKHVIVEFETAWCEAAAGESMCYRRTKKSWGDLVSISESTVDRALIQGEAAMRLMYGLKENNGMRIKQATRNELKVFFGSKLVSAAMRSKKSEFVQEVSRQESAKIERMTGMPIDAIWSAIRKGNEELITRLGLIPSSKREQMRNSGMYVANHEDPQIALLNGADRPQKKHRRKARAGLPDITAADSQMALFK